MKSRQHIIAKIAKWMQEAEECLTREDAQKAIRKARKHTRRLAEIEARDQINQ